MYEMIAFSTPTWLDLGDTLFRILLPVLGLIVLWEAATLLAVLIRWMGGGDARPNAGPSRGGSR